MSFLKAEWRKLAIANYQVEPALLGPFLPNGTQWDLYEGNCFLSLVGFMFINTRLLGSKIPFHTDFEEVNLRFYVKRKENGAWKRGVVFIKEIVPRHALTLVANTLYKERYETQPMSHRWQVDAKTRTVEYRWKKEGRWQTFSITAGIDPSVIDPGSDTEFITEHYWGYSKVNGLTTNEYEVTHPKWMQYKVEQFEIDVDFAATYGTGFSFMNGAAPASVMLAEGSEITVENKRTIREAATRLLE